MAISSRSVGMTEIHCNFAQNPFRRISRRISQFRAGFPAKKPAAGACEEQDELTSGSAARIQRRDKQLPEIIGSDRELMSKLTTLGRPYRHFPFMGNRHVETIFASFFRSLPVIKFRRECLRMEDGGTVALDCPLSGAVSLCNPFNLVIADEDFHKGFNNVYDKALARGLRKIFQKHTRLFEGIEGEYNIPTVAKARSVRDFDEGLTRVSFGFKSVDDYYSNSSSSLSIKYVQTSLLCIQAANDPIAPSRGIPWEDIKENPNCLLVVTPNGGHLGWVAGDDVPFGAPWTDPLVMEYLEVLENNQIEKPLRRTIDDVHTPRVDSVHTRETNNYKSPIENVN
uniref:AB hydrolase-1 domain-containing protein n=1 Tax=Picea sitchensis TaxID=3332 RepID=A9P213_PICSI|nr:unknown [Picea sitchensis]